MLAETTAVADGVSGEEDDKEEDECDVTIATAVSCVTSPAKKYKANPLNQQETLYLKQSKTHEQIYTHAHNNSIP